MNYLQELWAALDFGSLRDILLRLASVFLCLTIHETCHGLAAYALGDPTAKRMHRLSLNPLRHIDWMGLLMMVTLGFGWAKPVPVDPRYFRKPKQGMALTALAGPVSNFLLALVLLVGARIMVDHAAYSALNQGILDFLVSTVPRCCSPCCRIGCTTRCCGMSASECSCCGVWCCWTWAAGR